MRASLFLIPLAAAFVRPGDAAAQPTPAPQFAATREALCTLDPAMPGCRGPVPDTIPDEWWYLPRRHGEITSRTRGFVCIADAVTLRFSPGVALAEKQAIIDSIGVLEGGHSYMGSIYIVRIPGDGTTGPLSRALEHARGRPQVQSIAQACYHQMERAEEPRESRPVERLLDSAAIAALSRLPPPPDTARRARAFYIHFDSAGRPDTVRTAFPLLLDSTFAARVGDALQTTLRVGPPFQPFNVMVIVNTGPDASLTPWVFAGRQPRVVNLTHVSRQLQRAIRPLRERDTLLFGRQFTVHVKMIANVDGTVTSASVLRSSGVPAVDSVALNAASAYHFSPGEVEGIPTPMWVWLPLSIVFPEETEAERRRRLRRQATSSSPPH
jgi:TonB family protein